jgi:hypothetical protein
MFDRVQVIGGPGDLGALNSRRELVEGRAALESCPMITP